MGINSKDKRDYYYFKAKKCNYRARSAFKLLDIDETYGIFNEVQNVVDLCAAPGSWSQVLSEKVRGTIISVDVQEMEAIGNVHILKADITSKECEEKILEIVRTKNTEDNNIRMSPTNRPITEKSDDDTADCICSSTGYIDLVVCDGAPDVTGFHDLDQYLQMDLLKKALLISTKILKKNATFISKCFRGEYTTYIVQHFKKFFKEVILTKPKSSRGNSIECFILARGYMHPVKCCKKGLEHSKAPSITDLKCSCSDWDEFVTDIDFSVPIINIECLECGNGPNPDYTVEYIVDEENSSSHETRSLPINPPYKNAIESRKCK